MLTGAVAAGQQRRKYQAVILQDARRHARAASSAPSCSNSPCSATAVAVFALAAGTITAWALCKWAFEVKFVFSGLAAVETVMLALALVAGVGAIATWRVLSAKAAPYLRGE